MSGYLMNATGGYPIGFFWLFEVPGLPKLPALSDFASALHVLIGQWLVYALVILHVAATAWHVAVKKDGILERMLPCPEVLRYGQKEQPGSSSLLRTAVVQWCG